MVTKRGLRREFVRCASDLCPSFFYTRALKGFAVARASRSRRVTPTAPLTSVSAAAARGWASSATIRPRAHGLQAGDAVGPPSNPLWSEAGVHAREHPLVSVLVPGIAAGDSGQSDVVVRGLHLGKEGLPVVGDMFMLSALHQDSYPWAGADDYDGVANERGITNKHSTYPELATSDRVKFLVLACEEGGRWSPDVYRVVKDLVDL